MTGLLLQGSNHAPRSFSSLCFAAGRNFTQISLKSKAEHFVLRQLCTPYTPDPPSRDLAGTLEGLSWAWGRAAARRWARSGVSPQPCPRTGVLPGVCSVCEHGSVGAQKVSPAPGGERVY